MEIPAWLAERSLPPQQGFGEPQHTAGKRRPKGERFLDRTLRHVISFIEDVAFNENLSARKGFLQEIEPGLKIISFLIMIVALSLQRSPGGVALFILIAGIMVLASKIPPSFFMKRLLPALTLTAFIAVPAAFNLIVEGKPLFVLYRSNGAFSLGPLLMPGEITITEPGLKSAMTLLLRVTASVSFVFLMTMTTTPNRLIKVISSLFPGFLRSVVSISYRYIFFLIRKVEQSVMGLKSRRISTLSPERGRHWVASRIGLLFLISMELSSELGTAMEARGYKGEEVRTRGPELRLRYSWKDLSWFFFTVFFCGVMTWNSLR